MAGEPLRLGSAWYPEHWPEERWAEDLRLMKAAGMNVTRIAEFAWSRLEPEEGRYELDWLERAVELAAEHGIETVLGTPTAAPPAWLTQRYPETLAIEPNGQRAVHGTRCHFSFTNARYRGFCRAIAEAMAKRFGRNPHVIGWQIDNEYGRVSYDEETRRQFQAWLQRKYGSLENLNERWTASYWSQEYSDWAQIPLPAGGHNPSLMLEFRRFITHTYCDYQRTQTEAIRQHADPRQWITHNFMGWFDLYDHYELSKGLDLASWDFYVGTGHADYLDSGARHDLTRGFKRRNFWIIETQPGSVNWSGVNNVLDRGEVRALAWHDVGHGADAVCYWQWRSALGGQEQYHGSLVAPDGGPRPLHAEVAEIGADFAKASDLLAGTAPASSVAILHSYDDRWAINFQRHHKDFDPVQHLLSFYRALRPLTHEMDIVHPLAPLASYKLVVAPHLHILTDDLVRHLLDYVVGGGHLVLGPRTGMKDEFNALLPSRQPGRLADAAGVHVAEFYALDKPIVLGGKLGPGKAEIWAEWLLVHGEDVEDLLGYGKANGWLDGVTAAATRPVGSGRITTIGAWLDAEAMWRLARWMVKTSGIKPAFRAVPEGVEVCRRVGEGKEAFIVVNHTAKAQHVALPRAMTNALTGRAAAKSLKLAPRGVAVLVPKR